MTSAESILYDLNAIERTCAASDAEFAKSIRRWRDAQSAAADLAIAADMLDQAMRLTLAGAQGFDLVRMALVHSAIMAYARATERKSNHRGKIPLVGKMDRQQLELHRKLIDLRDECVGHHGPAGFAQPWSEDYALLIQDGDRWQPAIASRRSLFEREFARAFLLHLQSLDAAVVAIVEDRRSAFQTLLAERGRDLSIQTAIVAAELTEDERQRFVDTVLSGERKGRETFYHADHFIV